MTQTYAQLQRQIATLEAKAQQRKRAEVAGVIGRMKDAIATYGITAADLFGGKSVKAGKAGKARTGKRSGVKYADDAGNTWVGMGKRPDWLRAALLSGRSLEEFAVKGGGAKGASNGVAASVKKKAAKKKKRKGAGKVKFKDASGNSWTGFGPQPRWLKDAIAGGKQLDEFRV